MKTDLIDELLNEWRYLKEAETLLIEFKNRLDKYTDKGDCKIIVDLMQKKIIAHLNVK